MFALRVSKGAMLWGRLLLPNTWLDDIVRAMENQGGIARLSELYEELTLIRPNLARTGRELGYWQAIVRKAIETHSSDSHLFQGKAVNDVFYSVEGIGQGVWGLRERMLQTTSASDIEPPEPARRVRDESYRIVRDTALTRWLKQLHQNRCQICGLSLQLSGGRTYSEAHHIRPLGNPHNGPDRVDNILVLCPNHHAVLDYRGMTLDEAELRQEPTHRVSPEYINYHNTAIVDG
jgi:predicted restriction endonuclease